MAAAVKSTIFWDVTPYILVEIYRNFGGSYCLDLYGSKSRPPKKTERSEVSILLRNVSKLAPEYTASHPRIFIVTDVRTSNLTSNS
jgi:hypothetical protein